jgi:hypothetical protein
MLMNALGPRRARGTTSRVNDSLKDCCTAPNIIADRRLLLTHLPQSTRDPETAAALMRLAAEHTVMAEEAARAEKTRSG